MARYMRTDLGPNNTRLRPPAVVGPGIYYRGIQQYRTKEPRQNLERRGPRSFLKPPAVVNAPVVFIAPPVSVTLAPSHRLSRAPSSRLQPPTVIGGAITWHGPGVYLASPFEGLRARSTRWRLSPPAVVTQPAVEVYYGPAVTLAPSRRPKTLPGLARLIVLPPGPHGGILISYTQPRRPKAKSRLSPPALARVDVFFGPEVYLTRIRPRPVQSVLRPPTDTVGLEDQGRVATSLAYSRRGRPISFLSPPTDTIGLEDQGRIQVDLAPQSRGVAKSRLFPPTVVFQPDVYFGPQTNLVRIKPRPTLTLLRPFAERAFEVSLGPEVRLTYSRRGAPKSTLIPPSVVGAIVYYGPEVELTYSRRGAPTLRLAPPTVVFPPITVFYGPATTLSPQRRGKPKPRLRPPVVIFPFFARRADTTFVRIRRVRTTYVLRPPRVLRLQEFDLSLRRIRKELTYSRRGRPIYELRPPRVVREAVEILGPKVELAPSRYPRPKSRLRPPVVVGQRPFRGILAHLAYSRRGRPLSFRQPERVGVAPFRPIQVHLARIKHPPVQYDLRPAAVIGAGVAFYGPLTNLVRITPPPVMHALRLTLVAFRRPGGDVCGFDLAPTFVCEIQLPGSVVSGGDAAVGGVTGASSTGSKVSGSDSASGGVSGSDRKAT